MIFWNVDVPGINQADEPVTRAFSCNFISSLLRGSLKIIIIQLNSLRFNSIQRELYLMGGTSTIVDRNGSLQYSTGKQWSCCNMYKRYKSKCGNDIRWSSCLYDFVHNFRKFKKWWEITSELFYRKWQFTVFLILVRFDQWDFRYTALSYEDKEFVEIKMKSVKLDTTRIPVFLFVSSWWLLQE